MTQYASQLKDFSDLLAATAKAKNLPDAIVEKDYFVVRALRALCDAVPGQFVFKGGTSLAKGWNLLERFSEDIDLPQVGCSAGVKECSAKPKRAWVRQHLSCSYARTDRMTP